jgi:hypothetical protein
MATTETAWPWESRERFYVYLTEASGATITVSSCEMAFMPEGDRPADTDWVTATVVDSGTATPSAYVLVGPTGDTTATETLPIGRYRVYVRWSVSGSQRPVDTLTLLLT